MRHLLALWLVLGLAPGLGEVVESVAHLATAGHVAHSDAAHGDFGDQGDEHGCGATQHLCGCCASQAVVAAPAAARAAPAGQGGGWVPTGRVLADLDQPAPPHRPPIAS